MRIRAIAVVFSVLCLLGAAVPAQGSPPSSPRGSRGGGISEDAANFFRENSPHRYEAIKKLPANQQPRMIEYMMRQYGQFNALVKEGEKELASVKVLQIKIDDNLFDKRLALIAAQGAQPVQVALVTQLTSDLHDLVRQKVQADIAERALHIARAQVKIDEAQKQLLDDQSKIDKTVEERFQNEMKSLKSPRRDNGRSAAGDGGQPPAEVKK